MKKVRTLLEINKKINKNKAIVFTVQELIDRINDGEKVQFKDVDVITTATKGLMSGIIGIFSFRLAPTKQVRKFVEISLNGINSIPGPCPNEFLGIVDLIVYGTALSSTIKDYSGGTLFRDLVEGKVIEVVGNSEEGEKVEKKITLEEMQFARMIGTRQAIKNYFAMVNPGTEEIKTIFSVLPLKGNFSQLTFSGCGAMNPFQNDPKAKVFGVGTPVLVNGNKGFIIGPGTRNDKLKPNLQTIADFRGMKPEYMGSFKTSYGIETICSIAAPIPILNEKIFNNIVKSDKEIPLTVVNIIGRNKIGEITYGDVWDNNFVVKYDSKKCKECKDCSVNGNCPTNAFNLKLGIDKNRCVNCGTCAIICPKKAFDIDLKTVNLDDKKIPVILRQSDRSGAIKLAEELKQKILNGDIELKEPTGKLEFYPKVY